MRIFRKIQTKNKTEDIKHNFYVFDTETTKLEPQPKNFVFGVIYGFNYSKVIYSIEDFKKEFSKPKYNDNIIFAHNAEFDLMTIFGNIYTEIDNAAIFNGKFISAKYNKLTFADSMNIYPTSVKNIGEIIGIEKLENSKISGESLSKENISDLDISYCKRDCEIIFKALLKIFEMVGSIKITLPSISLSDYRQNYLKEDLFFSELVDEFFESYFGGRTEAFKIGKVNAKVYDINSMYPYVMQDMYFPDILHLKKEFNITDKFLIHALKHYEGLAKITVIHKKTYYGYLPVKTKVNGFEKLIFPVGEFTTTVNFNELRFAFENNVIEIKKVHYIVYGKPVFTPFKEFINDKYLLRQTTNNELEKLIYKLMMNSLYGKFGQRNKYKTAYYKDIPYDEIQQYQEQEKFCEVKIFNNDRLDCYVITENESLKNSFYAIPVYASYITSQARLLLLKNLLKNESFKVVYCDTDSIFVDSDNDNTIYFNGTLSNDLGSFKLEPKQVTEIRGLKNYTYIDEYGTEKQVIKGISRNANKTVDYKNGIIKYKINKYIKTKQAIRQNKEPGEAFISEKILKHEYDKRIVLSGGETKPLTMPLAVKIVQRKKPKTPKRIKKILANEPNSIYEAILHYFISGGKIKTVDFKKHIKGKNTELKTKILLYCSAKGSHIDTLYEQFSYTFNSENLPGFDFSEMVIEVINDFSSKWSMIEKVEQMNTNYDITVNTNLFQNDYSDIQF